MADTHVGLPLEGCRVHVVQTAVSGESMCEEVHPCRVNIIYSNSVSAVKDFWVAYSSSYTSESGYSKIRKISMSVMDGVLVGRRERTHSGVLSWCVVDSCAQNHFKLVSRRIV